VEPANFGSDRHAKRDPHRISCAHTTCDTPHRAEGALVGASQPLMECTRRLAALSRAVECLALDFVQKSFGCSSVLLRPQDAELGLGPDQRCRPPPAIRPRCRHQRPRRHRPRPRRPCRRCPRPHRPRLSGLPSPTPPPTHLFLLSSPLPTPPTSPYAAAHCIHPSRLPPDLTPLEVRIASTVPSSCINLRL